MIDAEIVHNLFLFFGRMLGSNPVTRKIVALKFNYYNKKLEQNLLGIKFKNPVGLAAGFDYDADLIKIIPSIGFGFETTGSVTFGSYEGNAKPRLGRLPKSRSILVNKGLKSRGAAEVTEKIKKIKSEIPLGISIAKTNCKETCDEKEGIKDYIRGLMAFEKEGLGDFYELNISCPNSFGGESFADPAKLNRLLKEIDKLKLSKPLFLKMPVDFSEKETKELCDVAKNHAVQGLIFGNLTKNRKRREFNKKEIDSAGKGNFSGEPTKIASTKLIRFVRKKYSDRFIIIGVGGIFNAKDAYDKIRSGANLVQLITGMIYEGPGIIGEINHDLVEMLEKEGYKNISEAVGKGI